MLPFSQNTWYWLCQAIGWGLYFLFGVLMMGIFVPEFTVAIFIIQGVITVVLFTISHYHRKWLKRKAILMQSAWTIIRILLVSNFLLAVLAQLIITPIIVLVIKPPTVEYQWVHSIGYLANTYMVLLIWSVLYAGIKAVRRQRQTEIERWKLEAELKNEELLRLREQINPHFIFNALNNIRSLVSENADLARDAITGLSNLLRSSLQYQSEHLIPLGAEVELVKDYLDLEKIQLEDRLQTEWIIDAPLNTAKIPAMSLQILVENAIKHGISDSRTGGLLRIEILDEELHIIIRVTNTGRVTATGPTDSVGVGLENIRQRLKKLIGEGASLELTEKDGRVIAEMKWPLDQSISQASRISLEEKS